MYAAQSQRQQYVSAVRECSTMVHHCCNGLELKCNSVASAYLYGPQSAMIVDPGNLRLEHRMMYARTMPTIEAHVNKMVLKATQNQCLSHIFNIYFITLGLLAMTRAAQLKHALQLWQISKDRIECYK